jgi:hypothetical protein
MDYPTEVAGTFKKLTSGNSQKTSVAAKEYNCIAWAADDTARLWWPDEDGDGFWPDGVKREVTLESFVQAFNTLGYVVCENGDLEEGFEKIAIYANLSTPTHAARQLRNGKWTSKLGFDDRVGVDISHDSPELLTDVYGTVVQFMKRPTIAGI